MLCTHFAGIILTTRRPVSTAPA